MNVQIKCHGSHTAKLDDLKIIQGDLKKLSEKSYSKLKQQILDEGFIAPFFVWDHHGELNLLDGTQMKLTLIKMQEEGIELPDEFPVVKVDADNYKQACKRILALSSQYGKISKEGLDAFMKRADISFNEVEEEFEFDAIDFDEFRDEFDKDNDAGSGDSDPKDDEVPEVDETCYVIEGDLWTLGDHRVLCGDSTLKKDVDNLVCLNNLDLTITSPPYNIGKSIRGNMYINDNDSKDEYLSFLIKWTDLSLSITDFVFHNNQFLENNKKDLIGYQYNYINKIKDILIWNKSIYPPHIQKGTFGTKWEYVFCLSLNGKSRSFPCTWQGKYPNVIETKSNSSNEFAKIHKAGFPVEFPLWIIEKMDFCKTVYDPFLGTGTTIIACQKTNRKCYGMEIDPHYVQVIIERYKTYMDKENNEYEISCQRGDKTYSYEEIKSMI